MLTSKRARKMDKDSVARLRFSSFFILTTLIALVCAFVWYFAPLGLGFAEGPANPLTRRFAFIVFAVSWFGGIPALLIGQVLSAILMALGRPRYAYIIPLLSIGSFLLCAAIVLHFYR